MPQESAKSQFNAGVAMAIRIDELQRELNRARFNLEMINMQTSTWNFEVMIECLNGLLSEAWAKMDESEQVEGDKIRKLIDEYKTMNPIIEVKKERNGNQDFTINKNNLNRLRIILTIYEKCIKEYLDNHDLNSPNKDYDDDGL